MQPEENTTMKKPAGPADYLANERTFLAWIRTSVALMGFGFVIVKFAVFVRQISFFVDKPAPGAESTFSAFVGVTMVASGAIISALAYLRYRLIEKQLREGAFFPSKWLSALVAASIIITSILLIIYLLPNL